MLMTEAVRSSETSILRRVTWRNIPEDGILQNKYHLQGNISNKIPLAIMEFGIQGCNTVQTGRSSPTFQETSRCLS
jgi:hypothetical protein